MKGLARYIFCILIFCIAFNGFLQENDPTELLLRAYGDYEVEYSSDNIGYRYYYNQLDDMQKQIYDFILSAPHESATYTITLDCNLNQYSEEEVEFRFRDMIYACDFDNPELLGWLGYGTSLDSYDYNTNTITLTLNKQPYYDEADMEKVSVILEAIVANANPSWDSYTKAKYISETIVSCMTYDVGSDLYNDISKASLQKQHLTSIINGVAVCEGYTELFKALADRLDLPCVEITSVGHAFVHICMEDGKWYGVELTEENKKQFLIPEGFAHGFLVLSDVAEFCYKVNDFWHPNDEGGMAWNDPEIGIIWPELKGTYKGTASGEGYTLQDGTPINLSDKDTKWLGIKETFHFE